MPFEPLKKLKSFLVSRSTVVYLIVLLALCFSAAVIFHQAGVDDLGKEAARRSPALVEFLGLSRVFTTWWFISIAGVFVLSLLLSTFDQYQAAWARMRQAPRGAGEGAVASSLPREQIEGALKSAGYRRLSAGPERSRHVKFWQGYWGSFLLHAGITVACLFSFVYVLTENRVAAHIVSDGVNPAPPILSSRKQGALVGAARLPARVLVQKLVPDFGADNHLDELSTDLVFFDASGAAQKIGLKVSEQQYYNGLRVYELAQFGVTFYLEFRDGQGGSFEKVLSLPLPPESRKAAYGEIKLDGGRLIKAKYYANADMRSLIPANPLLVLRLYENDKLNGEVMLTQGTSAHLGPYEIGFPTFGWWVDLLFEGSKGTSGIFTGFALLIAGGVLSFFAVPREVVLEETPTGTLVDWRVARFLDSYREECEEILSRCKGETTT